MRTHSLKTNGTYIVTIKNIGNIWVYTIINNNIKPNNVNSSTKTAYDNWKGPILKPSILFCKSDVRKQKKPQVKIPAETVY